MGFGIRSRRSTFREAADRTVYQPANLGLPTRAMGGSEGEDGREIRRLVNRRQETRLTKRVSRIYAPHLLSPWRGILDGFIPPSGHSTGGTTVNNNPRKLII